MKTLLLVRHAKSSHDDPKLADHDRPLNSRGEREARLVGKYLRHEDLVPDWIVSSTAVRAQETARLAAEASVYAGTLDLRRELYLAAPDSFVRVLRSLPAELERVMLVAHNPGLEYFASALTDERHTLPTSAVVTVRLKLDAWSEFVPGTTGKFLNVWRPDDDE